MTRDLFCPPDLAPPDLAFIAPAWILFWLVLSIVARRRCGKPIIPRVPRDAIFAERWVSGHSNRNLMTRMGGARNCLIVAVTADTLLVTPSFPFNLMFLPDLYGMEYRIARSDVRTVTRRPHFFGTSVRVEFDGPKGLRSLDLRLGHPDEFMRLFPAF